MAAGNVDRHTVRLPEGLAAAVEAELQRWEAENRLGRLWQGDASLWTGSDEAAWLGWLGIVEAQRGQADRFRALAAEVRDAGFTHAVLLGMGGSSLCPEVLATTFGRAPGYPALRIVDSTDPAQIQAVERAVDLPRTLCIVSSKSGTTLEPNILKDYFFARMGEAVGNEQASSHFIAITDPGSQLQEVAEADGFRRICFGLPSIGGRYSALSDFGLVPAAIAGIDVARFLERAAAMVAACGADVPPANNPGAELGTILGVAARQGRDKVTLLASPVIADVGAWIEQLLAESTGKQGKGLIPIDREPPGPPQVYGVDRVFVYLRLDPDADPAQDAAVAALAEAGQPVVRIELSDVYELGGEFFRWEVATAVAGAIIGINPFDQPDVEASKVATRTLADAYERTGSLPPEAPLWAGDGLALFADERNAAALASAVGSNASLEAYLAAHLDRLGAGDYFALLAYLERNRAHQEALQRLRPTVRNARQAATALGFGPRFLHSTGQAYKGGPNSGVFLQLTCDPPADLAVPGHRYTFGVVEAAQARGDFQVLAERGRRALRLHLGADVRGGLDRLHVALDRALAQR